MTSLISGASRNKLSLSNFLSLCYNFFIGDDILIVKKKIPLKAVKEMAENIFGDLVKAVIDIKKGIMAIGGDLHSDEEAVLINQNSSQADLWGINLYPDKTGGEFFIEFDTVINIRPKAK